MAETLLNVLSGFLLLTGGLFGIFGGIGLLRFPDFYSRLHAAGVTDTMCAFLIIAGLLIQAGLALVSIKLVLILLFMLFTAPTASHALARAGLAAGIKPRVIEDDRADEDIARPSGEPSSIS